MKYEELENEQLEREEQAIGEPTYKTVTEMTNEEQDEIWCKADGVAE